MLLRFSFCYTRAIHVFDRCTAQSLERMLAGWRDVQIIPFYRGAPYFGMSRILQRAYLAYENELERRGARNLATHYLVIAMRADS